MKMNNDEIKQKLQMLPWQALHDFALDKGINSEDIQNKEKQDIISKLLLKELSNKDINSVTDNYIYGARVTFTLWEFSNALNPMNIVTLKEMEGQNESDIGVNDFRGLKFLSVREYYERLEIVYSYSKEYCYINEDGHADSIWELQRGCMWIGTRKNYLASISKHEKMTILMMKYIGIKLENTLKQIKPPKTAINRCANMAVLSRIVLQGKEGEKTIISNSAGLTANQQLEMENIKQGRYDISGSIISNITEDLKATIKYNVKKGSIGIYKHLSSDILFEWSNNAIDIILEEIEKLKSKSVTEVFKELGEELKWPGYTDYQNQLNWFLTQVISGMNELEEIRVTVPDEIINILNVESFFSRIPQIYCNECDSYDKPYCYNCGSILKYDYNTGRLSCKCSAPIKIVCGEQHKNVEIRPWYIPTSKLIKLINENARRVFRSEPLNYNICIQGDDFIFSPNNIEREIEILFESIKTFQTEVVIDKNIRSKVLCMNEKCKGGCSYDNIKKCENDESMMCLPKLFWKILPTFRPQPHKGGEFGDVSGQVKIGKKSFMFIGIIKKNSENITNGRIRTIEELERAPLLVSSKEGEEIIRQFVEQGLSDARVDIIGIIAPQHFDNGLKATLLFLAGLANKKVVFIELDEVCKLFAMYKAKWNQ